MGYFWEIPDGAPAPFVPHSIFFPKKKARELQNMLRWDDAPLGACQQVIAQAMGWADWHALEQALKRRLPASLPDDQVDPLEARRRFGAQIGALQALNIASGELEHLIAQLGLTCTPETAAIRQRELGPWGGFQEAPKELAPGLLLGNCAKFSCFQLSAQRQAAMHAAARIDDFHGWYMVDDHDWRVILSFPDLFTANEVAQARDAAMVNEPVLAELITGQASNSDGTRLVDVMRRRFQKAPQADFAIATFPQHGFPAHEPDSHGKLSAATRASPPDLLALCVATGEDLLRCLDDYSASKTLQVRWFATSEKDFLAKEADADEAQAVEQRLDLPFDVSELHKWSIPAAATTPHLVQLFSQDEFAGSMGWPSFSTVLDDIPDETQAAQMKQHIDAAQALYGEPVFRIDRQRGG